MIRGWEWFLETKIIEFQQQKKLSGIHNLIEWVKFGKFFSKQKKIQIENTNFERIPFVISRNDGDDDYGKKNNKNININKCCHFLECKEKQ